jgi:Cys-tRNA(Pro)/Cys-tRNA(Cys) deacylase
MDGHEERLRAFMKGHGIDAEHRHFGESCHSVEEAARAAGADPLDFVKNICMLDSRGRVVIAIVKGEDRASTSRAARALGLDERPGIAELDEILEKTGYPCGGVPSFGFDATFLIDPRVMEKEFVWTSGGSENSLVRIRPQEMLRANQGRVVRIRK